jgi:hypothetical protein
MGRTTEAQIGKAVLQILKAQPTGEASILTLKRELPKYLNLTADDRAPSPTRKGEEVWEQQVRNLVSHRGTAGNIVAEGYATYRPRWLKITAAGLKRVS